MNIIISLIGIVGVCIASFLVWKGTGMGIKFHLFILALKLIVSSSIIGLFIIYAERQNWPLLILSGMINITIFHFIEAFITQNKLLYSRKIDVCNTQ
jgi:hypothetical protein